MLQGDDGTIRGWEHENQSQQDLEEENGHQTRHRTRDRFRSRFATLLYLGLLQESAAERQKHHASTIDDPMALTGPSSVLT